MSGARAPIGILGGTFDPVHFGHLRLAQELAEQCALGEVRLIPAGTPPHRVQPGTAAPARLAMVRIAAADNALFTVDDREVRRTGPCYTVDTLIELRAELGADCPLCLLLGADAFLGLSTWSRWTQLFELAHVIVAARPGYGVDARALPAPLAELYGARFTHAREALRASAAGAIVEIAIPALAISASEIRAKLAAGRSARYLLPDAVLDYIDRHHLYGGE